MSLGRLNPAPPPRPMAEINVTPLVDVMLVLVVILIVTAPLLASSLRLNLPRADGEAPATGPAAIAVALDADGRLFIGERPASADELAQTLARAAAVNPDTELQLRADQAVPYGRVVEIVAMAQAAGLQRVGFIAAPTSAGPRAAAPR